MRTPEQLLKAYEKASNEKPLIIASDEYENFIKAMRLSWPVINRVKTAIMDRDILLKDGIKSPIDGKSYYTNRREWAIHLKANGCTEVGNDYNNLKSPSEVKGDFDCRRELAQATHQIMDKYGH